LRRRYGRTLTGRQAAAAIAAGLALAWIAHNGHAAAPGTRSGHAAAGMTAAATAGGGGTLDCSQLEALWESAGGSASAAFTAAEIATAESGGKQYATDADGDGSVDRGFWQINTSHGSLATYNAHGNARAAVIISADGTDWAPWVTYQTGAYAGQC